MQPILGHFYVVKKNTKETTISRPVPSVYHLRDLYPRQIGVNSGKEKRAALRSDTIRSNSAKTWTLEAISTRTPMTKRLLRSVSDCIFEKFSTFINQLNRQSAFTQKWMRAHIAYVKDQEAILHNAIAKNNDAAFIVQRRRQSRLNLA